MPSHTYDAPPLPYADVATVLLDVIYDSLLIIYTARFNGAPEEETLKQLINCAKRLSKEKWANQITRSNNHVWDRRLRKGEVPRITRLCLEASTHAHNQAYDSDSEVHRGIFVPSPLAILVEALALPSRPESIAYGFALVRGLLFAHFKIHPPALNLPDGWSVLRISDVQDVIESFRIYAKHRDNIHHPKKISARVFLAHFLAMNGTFVLRFGTEGKQTFETKTAKANCLSFLTNKQLLSDKPELQLQYEFRIAPGLMDLPDTQELLNSLMGVPVPIAGGATVFFG